MEQINVEITLNTVVLDRLMTVGSLISVAFLRRNEKSYKFIIKDLSARLHKFGSRM